MVGVLPLAAIPLPTPGAALAEGSLMGEKGKLLLKLHPRIQFEWYICHNPPPPGLPWQHGSLMGEKGKLLLILHPRKLEVYLPQSPTPGVFMARWTPTGEMGTLLFNLFLGSPNNAI